MRRKNTCVSLLALMFLGLSAVCWAGNSYVVPTTTLAAQTKNNSSAANTFSTQSNGNLGANNVSKMNVHTLLYPGATTKVLAHLMLWFGGSNHMNVGYSSTDATQVHRQIVDMISRGIDGVVVDWYGPNNSIDQATELVMAEAEKHPGFTFAIMIDQGAIQWDSCSGCSPQQTLIEHLQYMEQKYFPSPAYLKRGGVPVVTNFNIDLSFPGINWSSVSAALSTHPEFLFQNTDGFTHSLSRGSYSWVMPTTTDFGISYLTNFYDTGLSYSSDQTVGATYKGFNDTLASWGSNRIMKQQCGQTWLQTFAKINSLYNSGRQIPYVQLVTWNDYEEGTEIESGIDDCLGVSATLSGNGLEWGITGNEKVVNHYVVYISVDGQNLMSLVHTWPGNRSIDLCSFPIPLGNYKLFVQAVGKPSLANRITPALSYSPSCRAASASNLNITTLPAALVIPPGRRADVTVQIRSAAGSFNEAVGLSCNGLPANLNCSFSPEIVTPGSGIAKSVLTISAVSVTGMNGRSREWGGLYASLLFPFGIGGVVLMGGSWHPRQKRWRNILGLICLVLGMALVTVSCGGSPNDRYSIAVRGSANSVEISTPVTVTVP